jgi:hypothetical protein
MQENIIVKNNLKTIETADRRINHRSKYFKKLFKRNRKKLFTKKRGDLKVCQNCD